MEESYKKEILIIRGFMKVVLNENSETLARDLCGHIKNIAARCIQERGKFILALSGGSLINILQNEIAYEMLWNDRQIDFGLWNVVLADERVVPLDHADSNYFGISKIKPWKSFSILPIDYSPNVALEEIALSYEQNLKRLTFDGNGFIDLIILGIGPDGHTASLFPGMANPNDHRTVITVSQSPKPPSNRISLSLKTINNAYNVAFVVTGYEKREIVKNILVDKKELPATWVNPRSGQLVWFFDRLAGSLIAEHLDQINC